MAVEKKFTCNICGCEVVDVATDSVTAMPGWGLRSDDERGWRKVDPEEATVHVCSVCGPALAAAFGPTMHPHLANALERARTWMVETDKLVPSVERAYDAVRLLRDIAEASK